MSAILELTDFNDPDRVLVLSEDTEIVINGEVNLRAIHMDVGCKSIKLGGDGKLCLHPKDLDHVAIGIPSTNVVKHLIWRVNDRPFAMEVTCRELSIVCSEYVQWFGAYGQFDKKTVTVAEGTQMPVDWEQRGSDVFTLSASKYIGAFKEYSVWHDNMRVYKQSKLNDALMNLKSGEENYWPVLLMPEDELKTKFIDMLTTQLLKAGGDVYVKLQKANKAIVVFALGFCAFYDVELDMRFIYDCLSICSAYNRRNFTSNGEVQVQTFFAANALAAISDGDFTHFSLSALDAQRLYRNYCASNTIDPEVARLNTEMMACLNETTKPKYYSSLEDQVRRIVSYGVRGV